MVEFELLRTKDGRYLKRYYAAALFGSGYDFLFKSTLRPCGARSLVCSLKVWKG
jgi:hypothetical protein